MIAVADGRLSKLGRSRGLGLYVELQDAYGNTYSYAHLEQDARTQPAPKHPDIAPVKRRLFANPARPNTRTAGGRVGLKQAGQASSATRATAGARACAPERG